MKTKISVVTMPGAAMGSSTRSSAVTVLHPSMQAACSISGEMETKVPRSNQMAKAWLKAALMKISPGRESLSRRSVSSREIPTSRTTGENIWLMITKPRNSFLPRNLIRAMA